MLLAFREHLSPHFPLTLTTSNRSTMPSRATLYILKRPRRRKPERSPPDSSLKYIRRLKCEKILMAMTLYIATDHRAVGNKPGHAQDWPGLFIEIVGERFSPSGRLASVVAALIT
jgi:hypothetical protein